MTETEDQQVARAKKKGHWAWVRRAAWFVVGIALMVGGTTYSRSEYGVLANAGGSMGRTITPGTTVVHTTVVGEVRRGDVVLVPASVWSPDDGVLIRRVIGVGGDTVFCCAAEDRIQVNDKTVFEEYIQDTDGNALPAATQAPAKNGNTPFKVKVPDQTVFLLGDERANSRDSRSDLKGQNFGAVPLSQLQGKVVGRLLGPGPLSFVELSTKAFSVAGLDPEVSPDRGFRFAMWAWWAGLTILVVGVLELAFTAIVAVIKRRRWAARPTA